MSLSSLRLVITASPVFIILSCTHALVSTVSSLPGLSMFVRSLLLQPHVLFCDLVQLLSVSVILFYRVQFKFPTTSWTLPASVFGSVYTFLPPAGTKCFFSQKSKVHHDGSVLYCKYCSDLPLVDMKMSSVALNLSSWGMLPIIWKGQRSCQVTASFTPFLNSC